MNNPFAKLGLSPGATADEVRSAYRALVKKCHPDLFQDPQQQKAAQEQFIALNIAYEEALRVAVPNRDVYQKKLSEEDAILLAQKMMRRGAPENALRQLMRTDRRGAGWYHHQGQILMTMGQYDTAEQSFRTAVRLEPDNMDYRRMALEAHVASRETRTLFGRVKRWIKR